MHLKTYHNITIDNLIYSLSAKEAPGGRENREQMNNMQFGYRELTNSIKEELLIEAESFIKLGYLLKQVLAGELYKEGGYENINDYARAEFNLDRSNTQRFMSINTRFSVGGNSMELIGKYQGYGSSKLSEMLTLTDQEIEIIDKDITVHQLREIKRTFHKKNETDSTLCDVAQTTENTLIEDTFDIRKEEMKNIIKAYLIGDGKQRFADFYGKNDWKDIETEAMFMIAPTKYRTMRIVNKNVMFNTLGIHVLEQGKRETYTYTEFVNALNEMIGDRSLEDAYYQITLQLLYEPKKEEPKETEKKKAIETKKPVTKKITSVIEREIITEEEEEKIPGQMNIEDYEEVLPEKEIIVVDRVTGEIIEDQEELKQEEPVNTETQNCPPVDSCIRQEWGTTNEQQAAGRKECDACWKEWKKKDKVLSKVPHEFSISRDTADLDIARLVELIKSMLKDNAKVEGTVKPSEVE